MSWACIGASLWIALEILLIVRAGGHWRRAPWPGQAPITYVSFALLVLAMLGFAALAVGIRHGFGNRAAWRRFAGRLALAGFSLGLALAAGEAVVRHFYQTTQGFNSIEQMRELETRGGDLTTVSDSPLVVICRMSDNKRLIYEMRPNLDRLFGHRTLRTNSAGMRRDEDVPLTPPPGTFRIVGVGDSGMWGWGLDQNQGYLEVLEAALNARDDGRRYEALNFAVPGYNAQQNVEMLEARGLAYQPDLAIVGWNENDFDLPFFMYTRRDHWATRQSYLLVWMFRRDRLGDLLKPELLKLGDMDTSLVDPIVLEGAGEAGVRTQFERLRELSQRHGFPVAVAGPLGSTVRGILEEVGLPAFNVHRDIDVAAYPQDFEITYMHPRPEGHRVIGQHLAAWLEAEGFLPAPGTGGRP